MNPPLQALAAVSPPAPIALDDLADVCDQVAGTIATFAGHLYFGGVFLDREVQDFGQILRLDTGGIAWRELHGSNAINPDRPPEMGGMAGTLMSFKPGQEITPPNLHADLTVFAVGGVPGLFATLVSVWDARLVFSEDGTAFHRLPSAAEGIGFRRLVPFEGRLVGLPLPSPTPKKNAPEAPVLFTSVAPVDGHWQPYFIPGFRDHANENISQLAVFDGCLWAATQNSTRGYQLYRIRPGEDGGLAPPELVLACGAYRYALHQHAVGLVGFKGCLYLASGALQPALGSRQADNPEIIRLRPDGSWDVVVGMPRFSPFGLKLPLSTMCEGFDQPYDAALLFFLAHAGWLWAGVRAAGRFQIWASTDGENWEGYSHASLDGIETTQLLSVTPTEAGLLILRVRPDPVAPRTVHRLAFEAIDDPRSGTPILAVPPLLSS